MSGTLPLDPLLPARQKGTLLQEANRRVNALPPSASLMVVEPSVDEISTLDLRGDYPAVRYYPPSGDLYFDVMTRLGDAASYETVAAEIKEVSGIRVRVATPAALCELKKGTVRALDRQDAEALRQQFGLDGEKQRCPSSASARSKR